MDWKTIFRYDNGRLYRKSTGNEILGCNSTGRRHCTVNGKQYYVHRIVWEMFNGEIPKGMLIDHINRDYTDNRVENLRLVDHRGNANNSRYGDTCLGVHQYTTGGKYKYWEATGASSRENLYHGKDYFEAVCRRKAWELSQNITSL